MVSVKNVEVSKNQNFTSKILGIFNIKRKPARTCFLFCLNMWVLNINYTLITTCMCDKCRSALICILSCSDNIAQVLYRAVYAIPTSRNIYLLCIWLYTPTKPPASNSVQRIGVPHPWDNKIKWGWVLGSTIFLLYLCFRDSSIVRWNNFLTCSKRGATTQPCFILLGGTHSSLGYDMSWEFLGLDWT